MASEHDAVRLATLGRYRKPEPGHTPVGMPFGPVKGLNMVNNVNLNTVNLKVERSATASPNAAAAKAAEVQAKSEADRALKMKKQAEFNAALKQRVQSKMAKDPTCHPPAKKVTCHFTSRLHPVTSADPLDGSSEWTASDCAKMVTPEISEASAACLVTAPGKTPEQVTVFENKPKVEVAEPLTEAEATATKLAEKSRGLMAQAWGALRAATDERTPRVSESTASVCSMPVGPARVAAVKAAEATAERVTVQQARADKFMADAEEMEAARQLRAEQMAEAKRREAERVVRNEEKRQQDQKQAAARARSSALATHKRQREAAKLKQHRFNRALHDRMQEKVKEMGIALPPLCPCGHGFDPLDERYCYQCCDNCTFYRDPEALSYALAHLLHAYNVIPADVTI